MPQRPEAERMDVTLQAARDLVLAAVHPLGSERVPLASAVGRVLAEDVRADRRIPPADNSAMDGFAVRAGDVRRVPAALRVVEDLPAGRTSARKLGPGEAARIMTGAAIPEGADAVVPIELTEPAATEVVVLRAVAPRENVRDAGSDVEPGTPVAAAGEVLRPAHVGMLAALGRASVRVHARARVAVLATGDEIVEPEALRDDGRIAGSNSYTLAAALAEIGAEPVNLGIAPDQPAVIEARLREAMRCDAVLSTGGVSVGDRDFIKGVLAGLGGEMRLWRIRLKPGAPLAFALLGGRPVFGLPGNPVSSLVTFEQIVRPALLRMMGHTNVFRPVARALLDEEYRKPAGRMHLVRVALAERDGRLRARPTGDQSSGILLSMVRADGLAVLPEDATVVPAGSEVVVQLLGRGDLRSEPGF
jgi:molybdopterin molybdotransferase